MKVKAREGAHVFIFGRRHRGTQGHERNNDPRHPVRMMVRQTFPLVVGMIMLVLSGLPVRSQASSSPPASVPLVDVIHIDIIPQFTGQAIVLLRTYRHDSLLDHGAKRIDVLQQTGRLNHFTVIEEWENQSAYDKHVSAAHTLRFRKDLAPMLGAPFDERPHLFVDTVLGRQTDLLPKFAGVGAKQRNPGPAAAG
jgi:quinol monooxygenase YgiN